MPDDDGGAEFQIEDEFRRMVVGARRLPRRDRRHALRAAFERRSLALQALQEERLWQRRGRIAQRQWLRTPRAPRL